MKKFLTLCTQSVHFTLNDKIYVQNDVVAVEFSLGPILAKVFMVKLENTLNPRFHQHVKSDTMSWSDTMSSTCHGETM